MTYAEIEKVSPEGLAAIIRTAKGEKHKFYQHTVDYAELMRKLITGDKIDELLRIFARREDETQFQQRKAITQAITPAVCASLMAPFYKVPRVNNITDIIDFEDEANYDQKLADIREAMSHYYGDDSLDTYMSTRYVELSFSDPNAFICTEFEDGERDAAGKLIDNVKPYPVEYSSEQAYNYCYKNNTLKWLVTATADPKMPTKTRYVAYMPYVAISLDPVDPTLYQSVQDGEYRDVVISDQTIAVLRISKDEVYVINLYEHTSEVVPCKRVGYKNDLRTDGKTFVAPLHPALTYLMKSIKTVSEMDLTMTLHAFHQKFAYAPACQAEGCYKGQTVGGGECPACKGTGTAQVHTSAQDAIIMPMPRKSDEMIDLSKLVYYAPTQVELMQFQNAYIRELKDECRQAVFNSELFSKNEVTETATSKKISLESIYDTLYPFALEYAKTRSYQVRVIAYYIDIKDVVLVYRFPKDFRFRTRDELLSEMKMATDSSAPGYIKQAISYELSEVIFIDSPDEMKRIRFKELFYPFSDKTSAEILFILSSGDATEYDRVLWQNFKQIFTNAEINASSKGEYLYDMTYEKAKGYIDAEVKVYTDTMNPEEGATVMGTETLQDTALNGSQVESMLSIVQSAIPSATGVAAIPADIAEDMLYLSFPNADKTRIDSISTKLRALKTTGVESPAPTGNSFGG